nr:MAG TPA: hypothetical protein [Caudoviricetes sp.]
MQNQVYFHFQHYILKYKLLLALYQLYNLINILAFRRQLQK